MTPFAEPDISSKAIEGLYFISLLFKGLNNVLFSITFTIPHKEGEDELVVAGAVEAGHSLLAGEHAVLDVGEGVSVHGRVVLVGAAQEGNVCIHVSREVTHHCLPRLVPIRVGAAGELHVQEHPVLKDDAEGLGTPVEIPGLLSHIDPGAGALDGIPGLIEHRVQGLDEDGDLALVVEVGELLQTDRVLVLDPGLDGGAAVVIPGIGRVHVAVLERQYDARNGAALDTEVRHVNLQHVGCLIGGVRRVVRELCVQNDIVRGLVVLNWMEPAPKLLPVLLNLAVSIEDARAKDLGRFHIVAATMGEGDRGTIPAGVAQPDDVGLSRETSVAFSHTAGKSHTGADAIRRKFIFEVCLG